MAKNVSLLKALQSEHLVTNTRIEDIANRMQQHQQDLDASPTRRSAVKYISRAQSRSPLGFDDPEHEGPVQRETSNTFA